MGGTAGESHCDQPSNSDASTKSDGSGCEEDVASLAPTIEKMMKNLRLEISNLKCSFDESRSDGELLQTLVDQQAEKIKESTLYLKELEEKENMLAHNANVSSLKIFLGYTKDLK